MSGELDAHGSFKVTEPVFARIAGRDLESKLGHVKDLLEALTGELQSASDAPSVAKSSRRL
jgi:hypothetical protein